MEAKATKKSRSSRTSRTATHEGRDELITEALGIAPGETLKVDVPTAGEVAEVTGIVTAASLVEGMEGFSAVRADKAAYSRIQHTEQKDARSSAASVDYKVQTLAYANPRKDGILLDFAAKAVEGAPARFQKMLEVKGARATMHVTTKNENGARALLEWLAGQHD